VSEEVERMCKYWKFPQPPESPGLCPGDPEHGERCVYGVDRENCPVYRGFEEASRLRKRQMEAAKNR
jgi:hypothetical protein